MENGWLAAFLILFVCVGGLSLIWLVRHQDTQRVIAPPEPAKRGRKPSKRAVDDQVYALLKGGSLTAKDIKQHVSVEQKTLTLALRRLERRGIIKRVSRGVYGVA